MKLWTYKEARDKIKLDLDLTEEDFVTENEFIGYFNEAIDEAEAEIHTLNEDYFLTRATLPLCAGESDISLPDNIYAQKIRGLIYSNGSTLYPVRRVRGSQKFFDIAMSEQSVGSEDYRYLIRNDSSDAGYKIALVPPSREDGDYLTLWYLRNANRVPLVGEAKDGGGTYALADVESIRLDIPEFVSFVIQYVKCRCMEKEGDPRIDGAMAVLQEQRKMLVDTLTQMVVDDDSEVVQDMSHYYDHE